MNEQMKASMKGVEVVVREDALEGARRATGNASSARLHAPDAEVAATAKRRRFSGSEKRRILAEADRCTQPGEIGALLRRERIYSSNLTTWRKQRETADLAALAPKKRGRKHDPALAEARHIGELNKDNDRLRRKLARAHLIIDVQKKLCTLLGLPTADDPEGEC
jgi:transposase